MTFRCIIVTHKSIARQPMGASMCLDCASAVMQTWVMDTAQTWFESVVGGDSERAAAHKTGIQQSTLNRQLAGNALSPENAVAIARAYRTSPLEGLVAIGLITETDITRAAARQGASALTDEDLTAEVLRRIRAGGESARVLTLPAPAVTDDADDERDHVIAALDRDDSEALEANLIDP